MSTANTIGHPVQSGARGTSWYVAGHLLVLAANLAAVAAIALVMRDPDSFPTVAAAFLVALLGLRVARARAFLAAWGEVPGAFGFRSARRGDTFESQSLAFPDIASKVGHAVVTVVGGYFLATLSGVEADVRAAAVSGFGGAMVTAFLAYAVTGLVTEQGVSWVVRLRVVPLLTWSSWLAIGAYVPDAAAGVAASWTWFGATNAVVVVVVVFAVRALVRSTRTAPSEPHSHLPVARLVTSGSAEPPVADGSRGWWATWAHYLPLTVVMVGGTAVGSVWLGTSTVVGGVVIASVGLLMSMLLLPLADRLANPPRKD